MITKKFLIKEYIKNKKSMAKIAKKLGYNPSTIYHYLKKYNIIIRTRLETLKGRKCKKHNQNCQCSFCKCKRGEYKGKNNIQFKHGNYCGDKKYYCKDCDKEISASSGVRGQGRCNHCANKINSFKLWKNKEYREKNIKSILKSLHLKPNKPEKQLNNLLQKLFPNEYKYVGNAKIFIDGFNPDFINCNGQKKIIELFGDYWHNKSEVKERDGRRLIAYKRYGYKTLIIWEHELRDKKTLIKKLKGY